jgi:hypothetical protein
MTDLAIHAAAEEPTVVTRRPVGGHYARLRAAREAAEAQGDEAIVALAEGLPERRRRERVGGPAVA